jgi:predicted Zn-dependent protease
MNTTKIMIGLIGVFGCGIFLLLAGCGGGASSQQPTTPPGDYQPNYVSKVEPLWHWSRRDLRVQVGQGAETSIRSQVFAEACQSWKTVTQDQIRPSVTTIGEADIKVKFVPEGSLGNALGVTETQAESNGQIVAATIEIVKGLSDAELRLTIEHELGHAFGVGGHSPSPKDVMFPAPTVGTPISVADTNTVLYAHRNIGRSQHPTHAIGPLIMHRID